MYRPTGHHHPGRYPDTQATCILEPMPSIDASDIFSPSAMEDPYPLYARMRALGPVCGLDGTRAFFVARHAAIEEAVRRPEDFSSRLSGVLVCGDDGSPRIFDLGASGIASDVIATADAPDHAVQRRLLMPPLKATRIAAMEEGIRGFASERVAQLLRAGGGDWCDTVAEALPAYVVMNLLGLDDGALDAVRRWAMMGGDLLGGRVNAAQMDTLLQETTAMGAFLGAHFGRRLAVPAARRGTTLTDTLAGGVEACLISPEQAIGILMILFGAAGESTASLLGCAVSLMLRTPGLQDRLRAEPRLIDAFVEEAVRLETPFKFHYRIVTRETGLCGTALRAGDRLLLGWASANRDAETWESAETLRLDRAHGQRHLGFGHGIHFCIGAPIARLEARVALEELLRQTRCIALEPERPARHVPSIFIRRLEHLQLRLS